MLFNSLSFLVFFPIVLILYYILPPKVRYIWLLVASYYFYMSWNPKYVVLLVASTVITYLCGLFLPKCKGDAGKKGIIAAGILLNLWILCVFKYLGFFSGIVCEVLFRLGIYIPEPHFSFLLPVGISFYTFQAIGYIVDVYRGEIEPQRNFVKYALFVSFFPQLVAGPIERSKNLLTQIEGIKDKKHFEPTDIEEGFVIALFGYILKMILADRAAMYVDTLFDPIAYTDYVGIRALVGAALFSLQIYCDFAGYTYIAIGSAKMMGIDLRENFHMPYLAVSIKDFWNRWHISLSSWFRDYLYFPLGGSRKGTVRKYVNIFIVFLLSGLWHGAGYHFILWGCIHGIYRIVGELTEKIRAGICRLIRVNTEADSFRIGKRIVTFILVTIAWVFFRAESGRQALDILKNGFTVWNPWVLTDGSLMTMGLDPHEWNVLIVFLLFLVIVDILREKGINPKAWILRQNVAFRWAVYYLGVLAVVVWGIYGQGYDSAAFIYFQF
jgi:D-alanyl-lipoteichoic acid acyltransferase DltB (MBOAT superfamily)